MKSPMQNPLIFIHSFIILSLLPLILTENQPKCEPFDCGSLGIVSVPFSNITHPECGLRTINCTGQTPTMDLKQGGRVYDVKSIFSNHTIMIGDPDLQSQLDSRKCDFHYNFTLHYYISPLISFEFRNRKITLLKCSKHQKSPMFPLEGINSYEDCKDNYVIYYSYPEQLNLSQLPENLVTNCSVVQLPLIQQPPPTDVWNNDLFALLSAEFPLEWNVLPACDDCTSAGGQCLINDVNQQFQCSVWENGSSWIASGNNTIMIGVTTPVVAVILASLVFMLIRCLRKKSSSEDNLPTSFWKKDTDNGDQQNVEAFFRNYGSLALKRFRYMDVKKITSSFKEKLGQGGYGSVFKGQLPDGRLVAVKLLFSKSKPNNGEEFINEVASISRTSHVNIVTLLGFCFERDKRALIYEFMPNGSLDKFIYAEKLLMESGLTLGWEALYQIAIGIARGLEYLHRGCNTRILHFDIKPHNILLDKDFRPKISDFGLAKLCPGTQSIISMLGTRGTAGYIAPEVFSRNFGRVSHKSDVYSYGMMVLEMVGGRKNIDVEVGMDHSSQLYFPHWIYDRLKLDEGLGLHEVMTEEIEATTRKMIIVGLWCIQTNPFDRPSMSKVLEMLESSFEGLQIPPKPFLSSPPRSPPSMDSCSISSIEGLQIPPKPSLSSPPRSLPSMGSCSISSIEGLQIPPKPFLSSPPRSPQAMGSCSISSTEGLQIPPKPFLSSPPRSPPSMHSCFIISPS